MGTELGELESRLGYTFADKQLLLRALTHKSYLADHPASALPSDNEQFEFLGDSILGFCASDYLLRLKPSEPEGKLSRLKSHLVSAAYLHEVAQNLTLGDHLRLGRGEELSGGRLKKALLANAVEALIAAMYLDGGLETCRRFIESQILTRVPLDEIGVGPESLDAKGALQELAQAHQLPLPRYVLIREHGPDHAKVFTVEARVGKECSAQATGPSKKIASQRAAHLALELLQQSIGAVSNGNNTISAETRSSLLS